MQVKLIKQNVCNVAVKLGWVGGVFIWILFMELFYDLHISSINRYFKNKIVKEGQHLQQNFQKMCRFA